MDTAYRVSPLRRGDPERLGEYWLTGRLGQGGMGVVYLAEDRDGTYVAIKLVHATLVNDPEFRGRFRSEVERARQVPSFCTAEVLDADLDHDPPYLVVEYVDGPSLAEVVEERGPLQAAALHSLAVGVATALTGIHGAGVIHRDLKPDNVLLAAGQPQGHRLRHRPRFRGDQPAHPHRPDGRHGRLHGAGTVLRRSPAPR